MMNLISVVVSVLLLCAPGVVVAEHGHGAARPMTAPTRRAPLLNGMGDHHLPITTKSQAAQRFFNQGLALAYGFNHAEAERSFREAARIDPKAPMPWWGVALVLGPNINTPMDPAANPKALDALRKAIALKENASQREAAYIDALSARYASDPPKDRKSLDQAYADAMRDLSRRYPRDDDAVTLFAEALMDTMPWDYWTTDKEPKDATKEVLGALETVLERNRKHPGANHFYIHAVEAVKPKLAEAAADRLGALVPGAGHLVHMPSHIYIRVGRYADASDANERAGQADDEYVAQCRQQGIYELAYMQHNHHFLCASAMMEGRGKRTMEAARHVRDHVDPKMMNSNDATGLLFQHFWVTPLFAATRFGRWDDLMNESAPPATLEYPSGAWHYARGMASLRTGKREDARKHLERLRELAREPALQEIRIWDANTPGTLLQIASHVLAGEIAADEKQYDRAIEELKKAIAIEDKLVYIEPPDWHFPVRHALGAVLLEAGRDADAEQTYRDDLERNPENGWSLFGLATSLEAQDKPAEAREARERFERAWQRADVSLTATRF